ncbi:SusC/RagA family TonB-linked outer membrane protein [Flagellimonas onchidii]|uniref:SusC/RagA family TonB-linked outer membrane protein n=1 Tax=Flagellimonas onchidii TaxID=2562684 RepID=UPI001F0D1E6E|nr:SusC/RagA family TonB-linked outer membrane protein [Allomuricauda onchidii]
MKNLIWLRGMEIYPLPVLFNLKMRLTVLFIVVSFLQLQAYTSYAQKTKISLDIEEALIENVFKEIENQTEFKFFYNLEDVDTERMVSIKVNRKGIENVLNRLFKNSKIQYRIVDKQIVLTRSKDKDPPPAIIEQLINNGLFQFQVSGTVTDADGNPLPGASIIEKGTSNGTQTDFDGNYTIEVGEGATLVFSYIGFATQEIATSGQSTTIDVSLVEDLSQLDEVVITALGISREKKSLGYSVTEVDGSAVSLAKEPNVINSLAGKVAGVVISQNTSGAGSGSRVVIRGNNSITGNNQPLYVVDGVPIDNTALGAPDGSGQFNVNNLGDGVSDLNPDDIESMSVLKGPNAAALYGSRASNGVIIITTKKGAFNKGLGVSFTSNALFENPLVLPKYQNQYGRGTDGNFPQLNPDDALNVQANTVASAGSWGPRFDGSQQLAYNGQQRAYLAQPDNVKDFFETGTSFINTIALSGGSENTSVRFSYTNSDIESILPNSGIDRDNFNLRAFTNLSDKLSLDARITYFKQTARNRPNQGTEGVAAYIWPLARNVRLSDLQVFQDLESPIRPVDPDNPNAIFRVIAPTSAGGNPYWILNHDSNLDRRSRVTGFAKLQYEFTDWLSAFVRVGTDDITQDTEGITRVGHHFFGDGIIRFGKNDRTETNYDFLLMFNKNLNEKFSLTANAGANALRFTTISSNTRGENFKIPGRPILANTEDLFAEQGQRVQKSINSVYGSASLAYNDMLYLDLTGRNDWSSALAADNRSYFYSSASLSALLNEVFDLGNSIDLLKVRGSVATVGNDTDSQQLVNTFRIAANGFLDNVVVSRQNTLFSESLRPEEVTSTEFGLELRAFGNRLYADLSYYDIKSTDLIFDVPLGAGAGFENFRTNVGEITNKGFEILVGGVPIQTQDFSWDASLNLARNKNKLVSLVEGQDIFDFSSAAGVSVVARAGEGFGDIETTTWRRNDQGQLIVNAAGLPQATSEREKFGNYQPDFTGGFTNTFRYKNLTLNTLIDFRVGGEVYSFTDAALDASGVSERSLQFRDSGILVDGVIENDDGTFSPNTTTISAQDYWGAVSGIASEYVFDQTNFRLREVSLSYSFPSKLLKSTFVQSATVSAVGRNLLFLYKKADNFDPESSYSTSNFAQGVLFYALPTTRSFGLSLNVNF